MQPHPDTRTATVALVGDRSLHVRAHARVPTLLEVLRRQDDLALDAYWIATDEVADTRLDGFDGIWLTPGSPYRSMSGALRAVRAARESGIPFLGTCGGFQHAVLEFGRDVCGLVTAEHGETSPDAATLLIVPLDCSLAGREATVHIEPGTLAERVVGADRTVERYNCSYELNRAYVDTLCAHGLRLSGHDGAAGFRIAELPGHPFFLATLFQPELAGDGTSCHPIVRAFAEAAAARAGGRLPAATGVPDSVGGPA